MSVSITVCSKWYNEEKLAPFFLQHYSYADEIIINLDKENSDNSIAIIEKYPQARIVWSKCIGGQNERIFIEDANELAAQCKSDWFFYVDSDEFLFVPGFGDVREALAGANGNVIYTSMWQIYKNETDPPLDYSQPTLFQRRHGDLNRIMGYNAHYNKPNIVKPEVKIQWVPGHQYFHVNPKIKVATNIIFDAAHWRIPDIDITIERRIKGRKFHFSDENKFYGWGGQHFDITEQQILEEYELHKNDPLVF